MSPTDVAAELPVPTTAAVVSPIAATDGELLLRFLRYRDEAAFAELVDRHAALVWSVCRQVLRHDSDVEDAFQATFLILARRAKTIRATDSAAAWLYRVAQRTALALWRRNQQQNEEPLADYDPIASGTEPLERLNTQHMVTVLVEELRALPERYQSPLVLCYLEGHSRSAAAAALDCTTAAVKGRLARGRRMLRQRLARRGVVLSAAATAAATSVAASKSAVAGTSLCMTTAAAASNFVGGGMATHTFVSPQVFSLAQEGVSTMFYASMTKPVLSVAAVLALGVATAVAVQDDPPPESGGTRISDAPLVLLADGSDAERSVLQDSKDRIESSQYEAPPVGLPPSIPMQVPAAVRNQNYMTEAPRWHDDARIYPPIVVSPQAISLPASLKQLRIEHESWDARAEGLEQKAKALEHRFKRLQELAKTNEEAVSVADLEEASIGLGDASLLRADMYMARAKQVELEGRIKQLEAIERQSGNRYQNDEGDPGPSNSWNQPTLVAPPTPTAPLPPDSFDSTIVWQPTVDSALDIAKRRGKLVLIHFWSPGSEPCLRFNNMVASNAQISQMIGEHFVPVRLNVVEHGPVVQRFGVHRVPTVVVVYPTIPDGSGGVLESFVAPSTAEEYIEKLRQVVEKSREIERSASTITPPPSPADQTYSSATLEQIEREKKILEERIRQLEQALSEHDAHQPEADGAE